MAVDIRVGAGISPMSSTGMVQHLMEEDDSKYDTSTFYRNPLGFRDGTESRWISVKSANPQYMLRQIRRKGFEVLDQYGVSPGFGAPDKHGNRLRDPKEIWQPILIHPLGPAEFPPSQIRTYRWWHPALLPGMLRGHKIRFPQFVDAVKSGAITVEEIRCPECTSHSFLEPWHLARHLRNSHNYEPQHVFDVGDQIGVDFRRSLRSVFGAGDVDVDTDLSDILGRDLGDQEEDPEYLAQIKMVTPRSGLRQSYALGGMAKQAAPPLPAPQSDFTSIEALLAEVERLKAENQNLMEIATTPEPSNTPEQAYAELDAATTPIPEAVTPIPEAVESVKGSRKRE